MVANIKSAFFWHMRHSVVWHFGTNSSEEPIACTFCLEDGSKRFFQITGTHLLDHTASYSKDHNFST